MKRIIKGTSERSYYERSDVPFIDYIMEKLNILYQTWRDHHPLPARKQFLLSQRFTVDYNFNSNHMEGNTLTYGQTELLLLLGQVSGEGELKAYNEMKASQLGFEMMREMVNLRDTPLTQNFIRQLHKVLLREDYQVYCTLPGGVQTSYVIHAGQYKTRPNSVITRYGDRFVYASPEETPALMNDLVAWYNQAEESGVYSPVELAALFHYRYIRIHPFEDGNGRIARLMVNYILARHDWPMIVVRSRDKQKYLEALHRADLKIGFTPSEGANASLSQIAPFLKYFKKNVEEELRYNIDFINESSPNVWWYDGKRIVFRSPSSSAILNAISEDSGITANEIAQKVGIVKRAVDKQLAGMIEKGYIQRRDNDKSWYVFATRSV